MIQRRTLLKYMASAGMLGGFGVSSSLSLADNLNRISIQDRYSGPLWVFVNAQGGWDVTSLCDPKGYNGISGANDPNRLNNYDSANIRLAGNIPYAPPPNSFLPGQSQYDANLYSADTFFGKYYRQLLVINGINCLTNSHSSGQLFNMSGSLTSGFPTFTSLLSATSAISQPLSHITFGGYSSTSNLIPAIRINNASLRALFEIAYPNRSSVPRLSTSRLYLPDEIIQLVAQTSVARHETLLFQQNLPNIRESLTRLLSSRLNVSQLQSFADNLEQSAVRPESDFNGRNKAYKIYQQGRIALAGFQQGVTSSVNIRLGGFDTHSNHDEKHYPLLMDLLQGVDAILDEAKSRGLQDRIVLVMLSDFGRSNKYNQGNGKDHWPVSSAMLMGNSQQRILGNRVVGETSNRHEAYRLNPNDLSPDFLNSSPSSVQLTPAHLHLSLRQLAGVENSPNSMLYQIEGQSLPLF